MNWAGLYVPVILALVATVFAGLYDSNHERQFGPRDLLKRFVYFLWYIYMVFGTILVLNYIFGTDSWI